MQAIVDSKQWPWYPGIAHSYEERRPFVAGNVIPRSVSISIAGVIHHKAPLTLSVCGMLVKCSKENRNPKACLNRCIGESVTES